MSGGYYITGGGETLEGVLDAYFGLESADERRRRLERAIAINPWLRQSGPLPPHRLLRLPDGQEEQACFAEESEVDRLWDGLPLEAKRVVVQALQDNDEGLLEAVSGTLEAYGVINASGDLNTLGGAAAGAIAGRATEFAKALQEVDATLKAYGQASGTARGRSETQRTCGIRTPK